jgi:hypothetical protein
VWDSALATWDDVDGDGRPDPGEFMSLGGWSHQPCVSTSGGLFAFVGTLAPGANSSLPCTRLSSINLNALHAPEGFVEEVVLGMGSSPAIADQNLYSIGANGLFAFGPPPFQFDVDGDFDVDIDDLHAWEQGRGRRDVDLNGVVDFRDRAALIAELRREDRS